MSVEARSDANPASRLAALDPVPREWTQLAEEVGGVAAYTYDLSTRELTCAASNFALWGWTTSEGRPDIDLVFNSIHPDDRAEVRELLTAAAQQGGNVRHDFRIILPSGEIRHIEDRARIITDDAGRPQRIVGLNIDITDLRRAQDALTGGEARFRQSFEHAAVGVAHVDANGRFMTVNRRLCEILGYSADELLTMTFQEITHPKDLEPDLALARSLLLGEIDRFQMEKRYLRPSGEIVWAELTASILRDAAGRPLNFISVVADIGARKQTDERLNFLLGELAHRSKNLLAIFLSSVRQIGAKATDVEDYKAALSKRLFELIASQDMLLRDDFVGAPVADLIMGQLSSFITADDPRLELEGPHLHLDAGATHALGLAMHELATNACKHGALSSVEGEVTVSWDVIEPGDGPARFVMSWTERGGPVVEPPARRGFGRRVIEQMVASSLGGEVDLRFEPEGLIWRLDAPATCIEPDAG